MCIDNIQVENRYRDVAQLGSAPRLGRGGRRFESCHPDHYLKAFGYFTESLFLFYYSMNFNYFGIIIGILKKYNQK